MILNNIRIKQEERISTDPQNSSVYGMEVDISFNNGLDLLDLKNLKILTKIQSVGSTLAVICNKNSAQRDGYEISQAEGAGESVADLKRKLLDDINILRANNGTPAAATTRAYKSKD